MATKYLLWLKIKIIKSQSMQNSCWKKRNNIIFENVFRIDLKTENLIPASGIRFFWQITTRAGGRTFSGDGKSGHTTPAIFLKNSCRILTVIREKQLYTHPFTGLNICRQFAHPNNDFPTNTI